MMSQIQFFGVVGKNGDSQTISTELPIKSLLEISSVCDFDVEAGLDIDKQAGINRPLDEKRAKQIASVFDDQLGRNYPMENGSVVLAATNGNIDLKLLDVPNARLAQVTISGSIPTIDRQHTTEAFRVALENPDTYPNLAEYISNPENTICVRIIRCSFQDALRRCVATNSGQKKWTPAETLWAMLIDAKHNETNGIVSHVKERPALVMYQFAYNVSKDDPNHPLYDLLPVEPGIKTDPKKNRTNLANFLDAMWPLYSMLEKEYKGFSEMNIEDQSQVVKKITLPYWAKLKELLPNAFGETWYNYNAVRKAAPLLAECFNGLIRLWMEFRDKKTTIPLLVEINDTTLENFITNNVVNKFIGDADASLPWKNEDYWIIPGGAFIKNHDEWGSDTTLKYIWGTLRPNGVGKDTWLAFIRTIQGHSAKIRYNERKKVV